ncbi:MAG: T9SS type A sorting domain-containing protein, partial [Fidelibacterota bacterium]
YGRAYLFAGDTTLTVGVASEVPLFPSTIKVRLVYPNPFNDTTHLSFMLDKESPVTIDLYNIMGARVKSFGTIIFSPGEHLISLSMNTNAGNDLPTGLYFLVLTVPGKVFTQKLVYLK